MDSPESMDMMLTSDYLRSTTHPVRANGTQQVAQAVNTSGPQAFSQVVTTQVNACKRRFVTAFNEAEDTIISCKRRTLRAINESELSIRGRAYLDTDSSQN